MAIRKTYLSYEASFRKQMQFEW